MAGHIDQDTGEWVEDSPPDAPVQTDQPPDQAPIPTDPGPTDAPPDQAPPPGYIGAANPNPFGSSDTAPIPGPVAAAPVPGAPPAAAPPPGAAAPASKPASNPAAANFAGGQWSSGPGGSTAARTNALIAGGMSPDAAYAQASSEAGAHAAAAGGGLGPGAQQAHANGWSEADFQQYYKYLQDQAAAQERQNQFTNQLATSGQQMTKDQYAATNALAGRRLDLDSAIAAADQAYKTSLLQYNNQQLAQTAARDAMSHDFQTQDLALRTQANANSVSIEREKLDLQRRLLPAARLARRAATVQTV